MSKRTCVYTLKCVPPFDGVTVFYDPSPNQPADEWEALEWAGLMAAAMPGYSVTLLRNGEPLSLAAH